MSKKIYFSPSSQGENKYAVGNTTEEAQCEKIALECVKIAERCGFQAKTNILTDMYGRTRESNEWEADLHIPIHTNAANGKVQGTRLFSFDKKGIGYNVCKEIMKTLAPITPGTSDSITTQTFYEIIDATAPTAYIEVAFHDNTEEAQWIINHTKGIAEAIVKGICNYYGVKYVEDNGATKPISKNVDVYYRVKTVAHGWLPEVNNLKDYAGHEGSPVVGVALKVSKGRVKYRVHLKGGSWLPWVDGYNINDFKNGFAGNGKPIDAIQIYYYTPDDIRPFKRAKYKVNDYDWQYDTETAGNQDGYAGIFGHNITKLRIVIE